MGKLDPSPELDDHRLRVFMKALLDDVHALEQMLDQGRIESGVRRVGAEQEMFLVDATLRPALVAMEVLEAADDPRLTTELARFNLEGNAPPQLFGGDCLRRMERDITDLVDSARRAARRFGADVLLCGILPTLRQSDLGLEAMAPKARYRQLNDTLTRLRGGDFHVVIKGLDELELHHDNVMLEACNTSFQVHFQVGNEEFARLYNLAQVVAGPVLAVAVNSPVLLAHRLWQETRVALFQRSVDERCTARQVRSHPPRVRFGTGWVEQSVLEIFREDIARFRIILADEVQDDPLRVLEQGGIPRLSALRLHNGTVYRWNRACYGIHEGRAHLRIENRVLPSGPTILDEMSNAAFFFGLMAALAEEEQDVTEVMRFDDAKNNFFAAARHGLKAQFTWMNGEHITARALALERLIPLAREGLKVAGIDSADSDRYLGNLEERVERNRTGAQWLLDSLAAMNGQGTSDIRQRTATVTMMEQQLENRPVSRWPIASLDDSRGWHLSFQSVGQFMSTDLITVRPEDLVNMVASIMEWKHIRHVPVEDDRGRLIGIVSHRDLLPLVARGLSSSSERPVAVRDVMSTQPVSVTPTTRTVEALALMRDHKVSCLPVLDGERLVGLVTEYDFFTISGRLLEEHLTQQDEG